MRHFMLVLGYDGTGFHGWQSQPGQRTVQGVLERALGAVLGEERVRLEGAGRTDAGVHARGQVASFASATRLPARALAPLLRPVLPADLRVMAARDVPTGFGARRSAAARRYAYRLLPVADLLLERYAWHPRRRLDPDALARATFVLEGEHDCSAFRASGSSPAEPRCRMLRARWSREGPALRLDLVADHFLYRMVRNVVGTALQAAETRDPAEAMRRVLDSRRRASAGVTAPPQGLCLEQVFYPESALGPPGEPS